MFGRLSSWWNKWRTPRVSQAHPPETVEEFAELLARSRITTTGEAIKWLALFRAEHPIASDASNAITAFCSFLASGDWVTEWQCEKLKLGRWKGFYYEDYYILLGQVGKGGSEASSYYASYKARDSRTNKLVCIVMRPLRYTGGRFEYRVYPYM
jgi:hypothetical protein